MENNGGRRRPFFRRLFSAKHRYRLRLDAFFLLAFFFEAFFFLAGAFFFAAFFLAGAFFLLLAFANRITPFRNVFDAAAA